MCESRGVPHPPPYWGFRDLYITSWLHSICRSKQQQGGKFGKRTVQTILEHCNANLAYYNPAESEMPELELERVLKSCKAAAEPSVNGM